MPSAIGTFHTDESINLYDPAEVTTPRFMIKYPDGTLKAMKLTTNSADIDTNFRFEAPDGTVYGARSILRTTVDDFSNYRDGDIPGPWANGTPDTWTAQTRSWASNGIVYEIKGKTTSGSNTRHTGGSQPGDGLPQYAPAPPFDIYSRHQLESEANEEYNLQWCTEQYDYESHRNILEYEPEFNNIRIGQKQPDGTFYELDSAGVDVPSDTTIDAHIHQKDSGHFTATTLGITLDSTTNSASGFENLTQTGLDFRGWGFSIGSSDQAEIDYIEIET